MKDRLTATLFLTALFHGILIIGVSFATPPIAKPGPIPSLEVILLADNAAPESANPTAEYLAQRNQHGGGTDPQAGRPAAPATSPLPGASAGTPMGNGVELKEAVDGSPTREILSSRADDADTSYLSGTNTPQQQSEIPLALAPTPPSPLASSIKDDDLQLRGKKLRELELTPNTRESRVAPYLHAWKQKVERIGTLNYPLQTRRSKMQGNPVLEVAIRADGSLADIIVRRSSGHKEIDQAALGILKLAAPFEPFPAKLKKDYDQLRFAYEWQFTGETLGAGRLTTQADSP